MLNKTKISVKNVNSIDTHLSSIDIATFPGESSKSTELVILERSIVLVKGAGIDSGHVQTSKSVLQTGNKVTLVALSVLPDLLAAAPLLAGLELTHVNSVDGVGAGPDVVAVAFHLVVIPVASVDVFVFSFKLLGFLEL